EALEVPLGDAAWFRGRHRQLRAAGAESQGLRYDGLLNTAAAERRQRGRTGNAQDAVDDIGVRGSRRLAVDPHEQTLEIRMDEAAHHLRDVVEQIRRQRPGWQGQSVWRREPAG